MTYFSRAFVGLLAAGADLLGTVGNATGTGLLLAGRNYPQNIRANPKGTSNGNAPNDTSILWRRMKVIISNNIVAFC